MNDLPPIFPNAYCREYLYAFLAYHIPSGSSVLSIGGEAAGLADMLQPASWHAAAGTDQNLKDVLADHCTHRTNDPFKEFVIVWADAFAGTLPQELVNAVRSVLLPGAAVIVIGRRLTDAVSRQFEQNGFVPAGSQHLMPVQRHMCGLGPLLNLLARFTPLFDALKSFECRAYRTAAHMPEQPSLTVCLTVRNERPAIEPIVRRIPAVAPVQEVLFVEGGSDDGTAEEVLRVARLLPEMNIRLVRQTGSGQGDAIRDGFNAAQGDIIILLEADLTSPPESIAAVYDLIRVGKVDFVEGSRFTGLMRKGAMPLANRTGNRLAAWRFSRLYGIRLTDVLCGIKGIRADAFRTIAPQWGSLGVHDRFGDFELLHGAVRRWLRIAEVPVAYDRRPFGKSKTQLVRHGIMIGSLINRMHQSYRH